MQYNVNVVADKLSFKIMPEMTMQERASQSLRSRETDHIIEPGTTVFIDDAAMGIIKVVSSSGIPGQIEDQLEIRTDSPVRKPCQVSLLTWELKR